MGGYDGEGEEWWAKKFHSAKPRSRGIRRGAEDEKGQGSVEEYEYS
jgi:hypothetical protein